MDLGNLLGNAQSFIFGPGSESPTYEALRKKREIADLLAQQAIGGEYRNWGDGVGGIMKALGARIMENKLGPQEDAERQRISEILGGLGGGGEMGPVAGAPTGFTGAGFSGTPSTMPGGGNYRDAIASIESSGDYSAMGPVTKSGDRAYGRYQVMGANIPDWTKEALGQSLTPEQFAQNPQAQDAVFDHRFGGYVNQYGPQGAASMWFSGDPTPDGSADQLGTSDTDYVTKFMQALGGGGGMGGEAGLDMGRISELAEVLGNPYADAGQKIVAQALIERALDSGGGIDPYQAARLGLDAQRLQLDRDKFAQGTREGPKFYGSVQWADRTPEDGVDNPVPYQIGSDGQISWIGDQLGGATPLPPTRSADIGTSIVPIGPGGRPVGETLQKDVAGAAAQGELGKSAGMAAAGLGDREVAVQSAIDLIDKIGADENLPGITGMLQGRIPPMSQAGENLNQDIVGLTSKVFSAAIDSLRGLGAMTEREGAAATQALANLSRTRDEAAFKAELQNLKALLLDKLEVARQKAAGVTGGLATGSVDKWVGKDTRTMSPEELDEMIRDLQAGQ
jgi:hypothetical protein